MKYRISIYSVIYLYDAEVVLWQVIVCLFPLEGAKHECNHVLVTPHIRITTEAFIIKPIHTLAHKSSLVSSTNLLMTHMHIRVHVYMYDEAAPAFINH